jgi:hypothetical protein
MRKIFLVPENTLSYKKKEEIMNNTSTTQQESSPIDSSYGHLSSSSSSLSLNTLEEPVVDTIWRDLSSILRKCKAVLMPKASEDNINELRDWDLWGPLLFCLILAICMGISAKTGQSGIVFGGVFIIIWLGSAIITINTKLLGGKLSFFQSVCVLGYCIFPLTACSIAFIFLQHWLIRMLLIIGACVWSIVSSSALVSMNVSQDRRLLSVYPVTLFYLFISYLVFVQ